VTNRAAVAQWVDGYERAWRTRGTEALRALFTDDAIYSTAPYDEPTRGIAAIGELWERERVSADERFTMTSEPVAIDGETAVVRVAVECLDQPAEYRDLWVITFASDGRCVAFEEWPFWPEKHATPTGGTG
jgi:ketosteroid isomerase-like protein